MVTIVGKLGPLRMNKEDFIDLVLQLDRKLATPDTPSAFRISLERFSEDCENASKLISFLKDVYLPKVVRELRLEMWSGNTLRVWLGCDSMGARYSIYYAKDTSEARSIEDVILEFRKKHAASRFFTWIVGYSLAVGMILTIVALLLWILVPLGFASVPLLPAGASRPLQITVALCSTTFLAYLIWSYFTSEPPSFSFRHSLLWMDKEPRQNAVWVLLSTIAIEIVVAVLVSLII